MRHYIPQKIFSQTNYALMVLNREIKLDLDFFAKIWEQAMVRHTVDGGSNHFYNFYKSRLEIKEKVVKVPELTSGDFDSIQTAVMEFLKQNGRTKIYLTEDQNKTDFEKALEVLKEFLNENQLKVTKRLRKPYEIDCIVVIAELSGRLDQTFANINTLYKNPFGLNSDIQIYLMSSDSLSWLLPADTNNVIKFQSGQRKTCGIIPINGPTKIKSQGLKWELKNEIYGFNGIISTSNLVIEDEVKIETEVNSVLFTLTYSAEDYDSPDD